MRSHLAGEASLKSGGRILVRAHVASLILLVCIGYFIGYSWLRIPPLMLMIGWHTPTELRVLQIVERSYSPYLNPGEIILAIDGRRALPTRELFPDPIKSEYELTLLHNGVEMNRSVPTLPSELAVIWQSSYFTIAIVMWLLGFLILYLARKDATLVVWTGLSFQLLGAIIVSPGPSQFGAPGAWIVGQVLICFTPSILIFLSLLPRATELGPTERILLFGTIIISLTIVAAVIIERLFLFPETDANRIIGYDLRQILSTSTAIASFIAIFTICYRLYESAHGSYQRRQLGIVAVFLLISFSPIPLVAALSAVMNFFVPYPVLLSLLLLTPTGYFFVLHRSGNIKLDAFFSRLITICVLLLAISIFYFSGVFLLLNVFGMAVTSSSQGTLLLFCLVIGGVIGQKPLQRLIDTLVYGDNSSYQTLIREIKSELADRPELNTIVDHLVKISNVFNVDAAALYQNQENVFQLVDGYQRFQSPPLSQSNFGGLKVYQDIKIERALPNWVELLLPIAARNDLLGMLVLSKPSGSYFNARQIDALTEIADFLAFGLLVSELIRTMEKMSGQTLMEKEIQRQRIATEIHNQPLHALTTLSMQLQANIDNVTAPEAANIILKATRELRHIITGLRPPVLRDSIEWITRNVVREFDELHEDIRVELACSVSLDEQASELLKSGYFYILTEALNNISKHAKATEVRVMVIHDSGLTLEVVDNGIGLKSDQLQITDLIRERHIGLTDMHRWASIMNGSILIQKVVPAGTRIQLSIP